MYISSREIIVKRVDILIQIPPDKLHSRPASKISWVFLRRVSLILYAYISLGYVCPKATG